MLAFCFSAMRASILETRLRMLAREIIRLNLRRRGNRIQEFRNETINDLVAGLIETYRIELTKEIARRQLFNELLGLQWSRTSLTQPSSNPQPHSTGQ